jgi:predicted dithiol-disulfide oxidoreductase (DUF899 family)
MGQACRYCTLWADGLNGFVPHIESKFANSLNWRFTMVSHGGGEYIKEQTVIPSEENMPGMRCDFRPRG